ncbi:MULTISPECIES: sulfatase [unclassified Lentimonas]|uniref:sulfatase family protein n=1 Tax=unclassified Lentimonas TaxID=2630993 RepID=UPI0013286B1E|nr:MULTISPECIES: sulfatase [unclassified Lentimonas]CAA6679265.1 Choline-sulfatase (EC [Lentimonas sp. CC4]CAA6686299.1 Choline-sulfatase (EC [Lentimonas sp. CC6]CAA7076075.1 Choline-sulfatase (EC [Lentimonas sp. CC4]CAA7170932.1 Choline-sulfatase (EC [Lentimonas sp. CC21]CAA7181125.1 Choline-sulfatase (EC [Lentimonas sp. CC8]
MKFVRYSIYSPVQRVLFALFMFGCCAVLSAETAKPNVLLIYTDDQGYADLSIYGAPQIQTPHIDALARSGVRLTSFYAAASVCTPSRASLLTGLYPPRTGLNGVVNEHATIGLDAESTTTIAEVLSSAGYATAAIGKWHLGHHPQFLPTRHGFDTFYGIPYSNDMEPYVFLRDEAVIENPYEQATLSRRVTDEAIRFIDASAEKPFFIYLAHPMPHKPLATTAAFTGRSKAGPYGDVVEELDFEVGRLLQHLNERGLRDNTIVVFTSDNGPWQPWNRVDYTAGGSAGMWRGQKSNQYEGGFRVPGIVSYPGVIPADRVLDGMSSQLDLFETLLAWCGIAEADIPSNDGHNMAEYFIGTAKKSPREHFFYYHYGKLCGLRHGDWKIMFSRKVKDDHWHAYGDDAAAATELFGDPDTVLPERLFNLQLDPGEANDVAADQIEVIQHLNAIATKVRADLGDNRLGIKGTGRGEPGRVAE